MTPRHARDRHAAPGQRAGHLLLGGRRRARRPRPAVDARRRCSRRSTAREPSALLLTHIHFDHAGVVGRAGAPLARPAGLRARARRARTWRRPSGSWRAPRGSTAARRGSRGCGARCVPVPERNLHVLQRRRDACSATSASSTRPATRRTTSATCTSRAAPPSSATSRACGSRRPRYVVAPTPPPDIDVEAWDRSLDVVERLGAAGARADPLRPRRRRRPAPRRDARAPARDRSALAAQHGLEAFAAGHRGAGSSATRRDLADRYAQAAPPEQLYLGARRYLDKRAAAIAARVEEAVATGWTAAAVALCSPDGRAAPAWRGPTPSLGGHWRVIVRNDDHNTFDHVAHTLARHIPGVSRRQGLRDRRPDPQPGPGDRLVGA